MHTFNSLDAVILKFQQNIQTENNNNNTISSTKYQIETQ